MLSRVASADAPGGGRYEDAYAELLLGYTEAVDAEVGTRVDYRGLAKEPRWPVMVAELARVNPSGLATREEQLAFWINAYNILVIDLVIRHYPLESIRDIGSFFWPVWKREAGRIGGKGYSLDEIEHEILRPMKDPRIHGAIVCAAISCPNLARSPYRADLLDAQLDASLRGWLARPEKGFFANRPEKKIRLSRIFKWFSEDFGGQQGVLVFIAPYLTESQRDWLTRISEEVDVSYFDYDWRLND